MRATLLVLLSLGTLPSCSTWQTVHGSGTVQVDERNVMGFHSVDVSGGADVFLTQGGAESLSIECDHNLLPHIVSTVKDGVLRVGFESGSWSPSERTVYRISLTDLRDIRLRGSVRLSAGELTGDRLDLHLSGSGSAKVERIHTSTLDLTTSGSAEVAIEQIQADSASFAISGSGEISMGQGQVNTLDLRTSGSGELNMAEVHAKSANVDISGSGSATLWADDEINAKISGSGEVAYRGDPSIQSRVSGSGDIHRIGR